MPWCDGCDRYLNPNTVHDDGTCPSCGAPITNPRKLERARRGRGSSADAMAVRAGRAAGRAARDEPGAAGDDEIDTSTPWHFKVLLVALVIYLGWRLVQGVLWVTHKL